MYRLITFFALLLFSLSGVSAAGDPETGREKAKVCAACHMLDGNSSNPVWPKLAGQHMQYIIKQLSDYKEGRRENPQMSPMASDLSKQDMADLASWFASQSIKYGKTDPDMLELGEKIYRAGNLEAGVPACIACHGPTGQGNPLAVYPKLGGQHAAYTEAQLNAFRQDKRTNDINEVMRTIVDRMTDDEIKAVSEYVQGLH
ncbi:MAG TPA: c-type cytochrome [Gammaproteobacteria bacterium]|nr:c-type cytochrome [Gammaproteobacteria bacterium]